MKLSALAATTVLAVALLTPTAGATTTVEVGTEGRAAPATSRATAAPRCLGKPVTIVATRMRGRTEVRGTRGPDVILLRGRGRGRVSVSVNAGAGDDRICVRSRTGGRIKAGRGNDRIKVSSNVRVDVTLGPGNDRYVGGPGTDSVQGSAKPQGRDVIRTRGGQDFFYGDRRAPGAVDRVDLGAGDDVYEVRDAKRVPVDGGAGEDHMTVYGDEAPLTMDASTRTLRRGDTLRASWDSFESFWIQTYGDIDYTGSPGADDVSLISWDGLVRAQMGDGDDTLDMRTRTRWELVDGGPGRDLLSTGVGNAATASLRTQSISDPTGTRMFSGFEDLFVEAFDTVLLEGDDGPNDLTVNGCGATILGHGGDDRLEVAHEFRDDDWPTCLAKGRGAGRLEGGDGDDVLLGNSDDDVLVGGAGNDSADGHDGTDTCEAETRERCEA